MSESYEPCAVCGTLLRHECKGPGGEQNALQVMARDAAAWKKRAEAAEAKLAALSTEAETLLQIQRTHGNGIQALTNDRDRWRIRAEAAEAGIDDKTTRLDECRAMLREAERVAEYCEKYARERLDGHAADVERETIARVVAWLSHYAEHDAFSEEECARILAMLKSGEWRKGGE